MFERVGKKLRQGDIAICEFHQLRSRSGEPKGPGGPASPTPQLPDFGASQTFEIPVQVPGRGEPVLRHLRLWLGPAMVVHQSCELEYADPEDSRVGVAPIVSAERWTQGPWTNSTRSPARIPLFASTPRTGCRCAGARRRMARISGGTSKRDVDFARHGEAEPPYEVGSGSTPVASIGACELL